MKKFKFINQLKKWSTSAIDPKYRVGMRVVKTAIAVMICLIISLMLDNTNIIQISAVSALITLRPSQKDTLQTGVYRTVGTIIGGLLGLLCVLIGQVLPYYEEGLFVLVIPLMIVLDFYICNVLKLYDAGVISCVVLIIVASRIPLPLNEAFSYTASRVVDTLIGVVVATVLNKIFVIPRHEGENEQEK